MFGKGEPIIFSFIGYMGLGHNGPWKSQADRGFAQKGEDGDSVSGTSASVNEILCQKVENQPFSHSDEGRPRRGRGCLYRLPPARHAERNPAHGDCQPIVLKFVTYDFSRPIRGAIPGL